MTQDERLASDVDLRLIDLWSDLWCLGEPTGEVLGAAVRMAYGYGYRDGLTERPRGKLYRDHGYPVPRQSRQGPVEP
ncbi:MAG: hypothetical protein ACXVRK_07705 [Gaiellaceae bacterium]